MTYDFRVPPGSSVVLPEGNWKVSGYGNSYLQFQHSRDKSKRFTMSSRSAWGTQGELSLRKGMRRSRSEKKKRRVTRKTKQYLQQANNFSLLGKLYRISAYGEKSARVFSCRASQVLVPGLGFSDISHSKTWISIEIHSAHCQNYQVCVRSMKLTGPESFRLSVMSLVHLNTYAITKSSLF